MVTKHRGGVCMSEYQGGFALIVVLFILLVIVGTAWF
ncbi:YjcZ family sporulation protein [Bacillus sp. JCM 19041]